MINSNFVSFACIFIETSVVNCFYYRREAEYAKKFTENPTEYI